MICMRPDLCFAVGLLARYSNKVSKVAAAGVTQLMQFCWNTRHQTLRLGGATAYVQIHKYSSSLLTDSTVAESMVTSLAVSERSRHIAIKYHYVKEVEAAGVITTEHVDTKLNVADLGTKVLGRRVLEPCMLI